MDSFQVQFMKLSYRSIDSARADRNNKKYSERFYIIVCRHYTLIFNAKTWTVEQHQPPANSTLGMDSRMGASQSLSQIMSYAYRNSNAGIGQRQAACSQSSRFAVRINVSGALEATCGRLATATCHT